MLSPQIPPSSRRGSRVPLVAAAVATVVLVPFIVKDLFGSSDDSADTRVATVTATTDPPPTTTTVPAAPNPVEVPGAATTVEIDPGWPAKGTSVFGESEAETRARIKSREATTATPELPAATSVSTTRPVGTGGGSGSTTAPTTAGPVKAPNPPPAPTAAPTTAARTTVAPTTQAPTTTAAPAAAPAADG